MKFHIYCESQIIIKSFRLSVIRIIATRLKPSQISTSLNSSEQHEIRQMKRATTLYCEMNPGAQITYLPQGTT